MPARSFGPFTSDGIPVPAGARVQLRVIQTSGIPRDLAKLRFGVAQLEPKGSGGLLLPGTGEPEGPPNPGSGAFPGGFPDPTVGSWFATSSGLWYLQDDSDTTIERDAGFTAGSSHRAVAYRPDGTMIAFGNDTDPYLYVFDAETGDPITGWPAIPDFVRAIAFSPNNGMMAVAHSSGDRLTVIDLDTKEKMAGWPTFSAHGNGVAWSPDGSRLAWTGNGSGELAIIDVAAQLVDTAWEVNNDRLASPQWSPDGAWFGATANNSPTRRIWDVSTKAVDDDRSGGGGSGRFVCFSPDGTRVLSTTTNNNSLSSTMLADGTATVLVDASENITGVAFTPDSARVLIAEGVANPFEVYRFDSEAMEGGWPSIGTEALAAAWDPGNVSASGRSG